MKTSKESRCTPVSHGLGYRQNQVPASVFDCAAVETLACSLVAQEPRPQNLADHWLLVGERRAHPVNCLLGVVVSSAYRRLDPSSFPASYAWVSGADSLTAALGARCTGCRWRVRPDGAAAGCKVALRAGVGARGSVRAPLSPARPGESRARSGAWSGVARGCSRSSKSKSGPGRSWGDPGPGAAGGRAVRPHCRTVGGGDLGTGFFSVSPLLMSIVCKEKQSQGRKLPSMSRGAPIGGSLAF